MSKGGWGQSAQATTSASMMMVDPPSSAPAEPAASAQPASLARTLLVNISGNRATWNHLHMHGALWQVNSDQAVSIFSDAPPPMTPDGAPVDASAADRLSRAMIRKVTVVESHTNIDEPVAVLVDGLPPREFTRNGEGASVFLTGEGRVLQPQEIYSMSGNSEVGLQWMRQFPRYTTDNLETEGVMFLTGASYYFVHQEHPVVCFLRSNEEQLGVVCFQEPSLEGGWLRIDVDTFVFIVRGLRDTLVRNTPSTFNLNQLTVRITKPDAQRWLQLTPQLVHTLIPDEIRETNDADLISDARRLGVQRYFDRPLFVTLRLSIEYALPEAAGGGGSNTSSNNTANLNSMMAMLMMQQQQQQRK